MNFRSKIRSAVDSLQDSGMPTWVARSDGRLELGFLSEEDFLSFVNGVMVPIARQFGYAIELRKGEQAKGKLELLRA